MINIFGSIEDMKKKKNCDPVVSRTKKKKSEKKKVQWSWNGLLPIFGVGSRYNRLYHDTKGLGAR